MLINQFSKVSGYKVNTKISCILFTSTKQSEKRSKGKKNSIKKNTTLDFPGGPVVKNPPANAGDMGTIPGSGILHMP